MDILKKIQQKQENLSANAPITIAFLGDSVTQGCFECYPKGEKDIEVVFDYKSAYSTRLREILNFLYPNVQFNIINSGISGDTAKGGLARVERDVLTYNPDLVVLSYGLNDCNYGDEELSTYLTSVEEIIKKVKASGSEMIFLTQNYYNTRQSSFLAKGVLEQSGELLEKRQKDGLLKLYFDKAKEICEKYGIKVCDLYAVWEKMDNCGVDTTELLANKLNHPVREFHYYMAIKLIETILGVK